MLDKAFPSLSDHTVWLLTESVYDTLSYSDFSYPPNFLVHSVITFSPLCCSMLKYLSYVFFLECENVKSCLCSSFQYYYNVW